jgi:hypothetical protein
MTEFEQLINRMVKYNPYIANLFQPTRQPRYRYFNHKGSKNQYFWTVETIKHNGKQRYASGIYKYIKSKNQFRLTNEQYHAKRKDAKARALELWERVS